MLRCCSARRRWSSFVIGECGLSDLSSCAAATRTRARCGANRDRGRPVNDVVAQARVRNQLLASGRGWWRAAAVVVIVHLCWKPRIVVEVVVFALEIGRAWQLD